jgi:hypothetical protein
MGLGVVICILLTSQGEGACGAAHLKFSLLPTRWALGAIWVHSGAKPPSGINTHLLLCI